jgi:hypothetical protein
LFAIAADFIAVAIATLVFATSVPCPIMKSSIATLFLIPALAAAFIPIQPRAFFTSLNAAKAAKSKEEDLELTRQVIARFSGDIPEEPPLEEAPIVVEALAEEKEEA